jgi:hypothetical protein
VSLEDEATLENGGELSVRLRQPLNVQVVPAPGPYPRATIAAAPETSESRDQLLRYKLIFKSGLAQLRHLLNQPSPDETDVETTLSVVGKLERQLFELSEQTENRDLKSTANVIREQLTELNAAVDAAKGEKTSQTRAKPLTHAKAIVEGLTELVPDIDSISGKPGPGGAAQAQKAPPGYKTYGAGSGYGGSRSGSGFSSGGSAVGR